MRKWFWVIKTIIYHSVVQGLSIAGWEGKQEKCQSKESKVLDSHPKVYL